MTLAELLAKVAALVKERKALLDKPTAEWTDADIERPAAIERELKVLDVQVTTTRAEQERTAKELGAKTPDAIANNEDKANEDPAKRADQAPASPAVPVVSVTQEKQIYRNIAEQFRDIKLVTLRSGSQAELEKAHNRLGAVHRAASLNEGADSTGGYAVEKTFQKEIIKIQFAKSQLWSKCRPLPLDPGSNTAEIPYLQDKNRTNGQRNCGVTVKWLNEGGTIQKTEIAKLKYMDMKLKKVACYFDASSEALRHAGVFKNLTMDLIGDELGFQFDEMVLNGPGTYSLLGINNSDALVQVSKKSGQTADTFIAENVGAMTAQMPAWLMSSAEWFINQEVIPQLPLMVIGNQPVYMPPTGLAGNMYGTLNGRPINVIEHASALGDKGDVMLMAMNQYGAISQGDIRMESSIHVSFLQDLEVFRIIQEVDGAPLWEDSITPYKGSKKLSPFLVLEAR